LRSIADEERSVAADLAETLEALQGLRSVLSQVVPRRPFLELVRRVADSCAGAGGGLIGDWYRRMLKYRELNRTPASRVR
jgi:hypothetical protein